MKTYIISTFQIDTLASYLNFSPNSPILKCSTAPFGQAMQTLLGGTELPEKPDLVILWTRLEDISSSFAKILRNEPVSFEKMNLEVSDYLSAIKTFLSNPRVVGANLILPTWVASKKSRSSILLDLKDDTGAAAALSRMNVKLLDELGRLPNVHLIDTSRWIESAGANAYSQKLWYLTKNPFSLELIKTAARDIKLIAQGLTGQAKKIIFLDLDDTLWGGIVGDDGWQNLKLGGHDSTGEAFKDFQSGLKTLKNRGILLAVVSKNDEEVALEAIRSHPEMVLGVDDFVAWKINWKDKAQNILDILSELNLGPQSAVFLDDNPFERNRVRDSIPEILVPDLPPEVALYKEFLFELNAFESPGTTEEDLSRTDLYKKRRASEVTRSQISDPEVWLKTLEIEVSVEHLNSQNLKRTTQLLNKTNQMNLSTRRASQEELLGWAEMDQNELLTFRVKDKFIDSGLTGILGVTQTDNSLSITDFVLSCRVMGRKIEESMLYLAYCVAKKKAVREISARYLKTEKNRPCFDFFSHQEGWVYDPNEGSFKWPMDKIILPPDQVKIILAPDLC